MKYDYLIAGAGFAGCVLAERLASQRDKKILLIDRRPHIGGNAYDAMNEDGIRIHHYGPHIFHTNDSRVFSYLSNFTEWHHYEHRVLSSVNGLLVPMPINRTTINTLLGYAYGSGEEVQAFLDREKVPVAEITNSEEFVVSRVGRRLFDLLYRGYTKKHWGKEARELSPSVCGRLPVRTSTDDRYFDDQYQAMPLHGYTALFMKMVAHPNIHFELGTPYSSVPEHSYKELIFTGPIDEYFGHMYGRLPYRSLHFEFETHMQKTIQPVAQVNYPNEFEFTRITEFKHITGQVHDKTTIAKEYSMDEGEPYYPIPQKHTLALYARYAEAALKIPTVHFVGRLAAYKYYNMDQVVAQALTKYQTIAQKLP